MRQSEYTGLRLVDPAEIHTDDAVTFRVILSSQWGKVLNSSFVAGEEVDCALTVGEFIDARSHVKRNRDSKWLRISAKATFVR
jgi:hypothetical protein